MLKRISVARLQPGMHLYAPCGSWTSHPFRPASSLLTDGQDSRRGGSEVVGIATVNNLDAAPGRPRAYVEAPLARESPAATRYD